MAKKPIGKINDRAMFESLMLSWVYGVGFCSYETLRFFESEKDIVKRAEYLKKTHCGSCGHGGYFAGRDSGTIPRFEFHDKRGIQFGTNGDFTWKAPPENFATWEQAAVEIARLISNGKYVAQVLAIQAKHLEYDHEWWISRSKESDYPWRTVGMNDKRKDIIETHERIRWLMERYGLPAPDSDYYRMPIPPVMPEDPKTREEYDNRMNWHPTPANETKQEPQKAPPPRVVSKPIPRSKCIPAGQLSIFDLMPEGM